MRAHTEKAVSADVTLNGQHPDKRWVILLGGFLLSLMGGMSYAWGSFVVPLIQDWGWTATQANLPFTMMIIVFAFSMIPAGWIQDRFGPRKVATTGAICFLIGNGLSALLRFFPSPAWLVFSYGIIVGISCGLTYACIAPTARKWYADRPGFAVSTAVMGFGLAAVVFAPLKRTMIAAWGVDGTFIFLALFTGIVALIGARLIRNPPEGYLPPTHKDPRLRQTAPASSTVKDVTPGEFIKTPQFYLLWLALAMVIGGGLTAISLFTAYGEMKLNLPPAVAAIAMSAYSLVNGLGRPFVGIVSDRIGTMKVMMSIYIVQAVVFLSLPWVAVNLPLLVLCSLLLGLGYATTFALFPVLVAAACGTRHLGMNYGMVFSAFALGAVTSLIGSRLLDKTGSFVPAFLVAGVSTLVGLMLLCTLQRLYKK